MIKGRFSNHSLTDDIYDTILKAIPDPVEGQTAQEFYAKIDQNKLTETIIAKVQEHIEYGIKDLAQNIAD